MKKTLPVSLVLVAVDVAGSAARRRRLRRQVPRHRPHAPGGCRRRSTRPRSCSCCSADAAAGRGRARDEARGHARSRRATRSRRCPRPTPLAEWLATRRYDFILTGLDAAAAVVRDSASSRLAPGGDPGGPRARTARRGRPRKRGTGSSSRRRRGASPTWAQLDAAMARRRIDRLALDRPLSRAQAARARDLRAVASKNRSRRSAARRMPMRGLIADRAPAASPRAGRAATRDRRRGAPLSLVSRARARARRPGPRHDPGSSPATGSAARISTQPARALALHGEVQAVVHPIDEVDVDGPRPPPQRLGARGAAAERMGRGIALPEVGLGLDDARREHAPSDRGGPGPARAGNARRRAAAGRGPR